MKILFAIDSLNKGGKERRMVELIKGLLKNTDVRIALVLFRNSIEYLEIHDLEVDLHIIERKPKYNPGTFSKFHKICKQFQPDVIHAWSNMSAFFAVPSSKILNIKLLNGCVANAPNNPRIWQKEYFLTKLTFLFSDFIVGNSKAGLNAYGAPKTKSISIPNGFDFNRTATLEDVQKVREEHGIETNFVIGKIAAFANRKDYATYIEAAHRILKTRDDISFMAIGDGPNLKPIKDAVSESDSRRIIFTGKSSDVESLINIFDVGVLSTNNDVHGEGISNSIMEYMAMGKPVVATEGGGTGEIVLHEETGFLIPSKSPKLMSQKILELIENPIEAKKMGMAGKKRIKDYFEINKMIDTYEALYGKLIEGQR